MFCPPAVYLFGIDPVHRKVIVTTHSTNTPEPLHHSARGIGFGFAHYFQHIADKHSIDVHISKGYAFSQEIYRKVAGTVSTLTCLVRPSQVGRFVADSLLGGWLAYPGPL